MKTIKYFFLGIVSLLLLSSCATYQQSSQILKSKKNRVTIDVEANLDLQHMKKVSAEVEQKVVFWFIPLIFNRDKALYSSNESQYYNEYERMALYRAKSDANVDIVLLPEFEVEKHSWFLGFYRTYQVKLTGWGTNIKSFEKAKD